MASVADLPIAEARARSARGRWRASRAPARRLTSGFVRNAMPREGSPRAAASRPCIRHRCGELRRRRAVRRASGGRPSASAACRMSSCSSQASASAQRIWICSSRPSPGRFSTRTSRVVASAPRPRSSARTAWPKRSWSGHGGDSIPRIQGNRARLAVHRSLLAGARFASLGVRSCISTLAVTRIDSNVEMQDLTPESDQSQNALPILANPTTPGRATPRHHPP